MCLRSGAALQPFEIKMIEALMWKSNDIVDDTYMIINELGRGGTGVIYLAYHLRLQKYIVLKRIKDNIANILKVRTEVDILKKLRHTYLPQVYDFMQVGNQIYTVIDYIDGCDLDKYIQSGYNFTEAQLEMWLCQLCDVLSYLHRQKPQILHCDIKPGNIMITNEGNVCLIDFNVSLGQDEKDEISGISQYYASPEQYERAMAIVYGTKTNVKLDQRTDIYSLGATFYHMISGIMPKANSYNVPLTQMGLGYSYEFLHVIDRMMEQNPHFRFKTTADVVSAIDKIHKRDRSASKLILGISADVAVFLVASVIGGWLCFHGAELKIEESFNADFKAFESVYSKGNYDETIDIGIDLLNEYKDMLSDSKDRKADILHSIGECYFYDENYSEASKFYKDAVNNASEDNSGIYARDLAISLIRENKIKAAEKVVASANSDGMTKKDLVLVDAEINNINKNYKKVTELTEKLVQSSDQGLARRANLLAATAYGKLGNTDMQIKRLTALAKIDPSIINYRKLGDVYIKCGEEVPDADITKHDSYYENAKKCYKKVVSKDYCTVRDIINLAVVHMELEEYKEAVSLLKKVDKDEATYQVYMYMAFACDKMMDYENAREYCKTAVNIYEKLPSKQKEPLNSDNIQSLYVLEKKLG